jgi:hypothetical protein
MAPKEYMQKIMQEIDNGTYDISTIDSKPILEESLWFNDMPSVLYTADHKDYNDFLIARRRMMADKIKNYYKGL